MPKKYFALLLLLVGSSIVLPAQLIVSPINGTGNLASLLAGAGLTISNVHVNCDTAAIANFDGTGCNVGISAGIVLSTGNFQDLHGPNTSSGSGSFLSQAGDLDLDTLVGGITYDACVLEFDCMPSGDTILFNFVFGSEEYLEFVMSAMNDGFAIWLTGPGYPLPTNVAFLTGTNIPVTVNNVNTTYNPSFYYDNTVGPNVATDSTVIQFDGFTTNLTSVVPVMMGGNYHFKIAVADAGDGVFDSGVFLQAGSFRAAGGTVSISSGNKSKLRVFPNPNHGSFHVIPAFGEVGNLTWKLYGADGNVVAGNSADANATVTGEFEVALPELKSGLYHLRVCQGGNTTSSPVLIR